MSPPGGRSSRETTRIGPPGQRGAIRKECIGFWPDLAVNVSDSSPCRSGYERACSDHQADGSRGDLWEFFLIVVSSARRIGCLPRFFTARAARAWNIGRHLDHLASRHRGDEMTADEIVAS